MPPGFFDIQKTANQSNWDDSCLSLNSHKNSEEEGAGGFHSLDLCASVVVGGGAGAGTERVDVYQETVKRRKSSVL